MATAPIITYLALDSTYDPIFIPEQSLVNGDAVAQAILTTLRLFYGEWFEQLSTGTPVLQSILGQLASTQGKAAMSALLAARVAGVPYVTNVIDVNAAYTDGQLNFSATAQTVFGTTVTATFTPGSSASLLGE